MQLHLDLLGGLAGDMFVAALLDAWPEHEPAVFATLEVLARQAGLPPGTAPARLESVNDGVLRGARFEVFDPREPHGAEAGGRHAAHVAWAAIRPRLEAALPAAVGRHALGIFELLAAAEAEVHGVAAEAVEFHELGAWDSIADIGAAACLIEALGATRWTAGAVPLGSGRVRTAHGPMPVPAPATARLLQGFVVYDDGIPGERVTPTGAAILRYLAPPGAARSQSARGEAPALRRLERSGVGFGSRRLPGISNAVRVLAFESADEAGDPGIGRHRELAVVEFDLDDASAEEIAIGLERLRAHAAVHDVVQAPAFGKKGRMLTAVRVLARPEALGEVIEACFRETPTIGLRHSRVHGAMLPRRGSEVEIAGRRLRVKTVDRPGGATAKVEADDVRSDATHRLRGRLRQQGEAAALGALGGTAGADLA